MFFRFGASTTKTDTEPGIDRWRMAGTRKFGSIKAFGCKQTSWSRFHCSASSSSSSNSLTKRQLKSNLGKSFSCSIAWICLFIFEVDSVNNWIISVPFWGVWRSGVFRFRKGNQVKLQLWTESLSTAVPSVLLVLKRRSQLCVTTLRLVTDCDGVRQRKISCSRSLYSLHVLQRSSSVSSNVFPRYANWK